MRPGLVADAETAVLRDAALGNIELAHDLDTREDGLVMLARNRRHRGLEHTVNAVLHEQRIVVRFDVNIRRAAFEGGEDSRIDETDDRADVFFGRQLLDRDVFVLVLFERDDVEGEALADASSSTRWRLLCLLQKVGDLRHAWRRGSLLGACRGVR